MKSVFIIGEQRSGSNLLRVILDNHDQIFAPHPPHIIQKIMPFISRFGDLNKVKNKERITDFMLDLVITNPLPWRKIPDKSKVIEHSNKNSAYGLFESLMTRAAILNDKKMWVCKSNAMIDHFDLIEEFDNQSKYIFLYRNPKDVVASFLKVPIGDKHPYIIAKKWNEIQKKCLEIQQKAGTRFISISYENLIHATKETVSQICEFLEVDFTPEMLNYFKNEKIHSDSKISHQWKNIGKPIITDNAGNYKKHLSSHQIGLIENAAYESMQLLGYTFETEKIDLSENDQAHFYSENQRLILEFLRHLPEKEIKVREEQNKVTELLKKYSHEN